MKNLLFYFLFYLLGFSALGQKPNLDWGIYLPSSSVDQAGAYLEGLKELGVENVVLDKAYFDFFQKKSVDIKTMVKKFKLDDVGLDAGVLESKDFEKYGAEIEAMAQFTREIGGEFLVVKARKRDAYPPGQAELTQLGGTLATIAGKVRKYGIILVFQNQLHTICQTGEELEWVIQATKGKPVKFQINTAHLIQAGSGNFDFLKKLKKKTEIIGIQGLISPKPGHQGSKIYDYKLTTIDQPGRIDFKVHFQQLKNVNVHAIGLLRVEESSDLTGFLQKVKEQVDFLKLQFGYRF